MTPQSKYNELNPNGQICLPSVWIQRTYEKKRIDVGTDDWIPRVLNRESYSKTVSTRSIYK
jgi:hypothetical protein